MVFNLTSLISFINLILILSLIVITYKIKIGTEKKLYDWNRYNLITFSIMGILVLLKILNETAILTINLNVLNETAILNVNFSWGIILTGLLLSLAATNQFLAKSVLSIEIKNKRNLRFDNISISSFFNNLSKLLSSFFLRK